MVIPAATKLLAAAADSAMRRYFDHGLVRYCSADLMLSIRTHLGR